MKSQMSVRFMLVDPVTKKYIKAVDEQDFSDYINLITKTNEESTIKFFDFSIVVEAVHNEIDAQLKYREKTEVSVKRNNVFNGWKRIRSIKNEKLLNASVANVLSEAEDALNWMHTRLPKFKSVFLYATPNYDYTLQKDERADALREFSGEIDAFIEVLLCSMHSMLQVDPAYFKDEDVCIGHCDKIRDLLIDALSTELGYRNGDFDWNSFIYQCVMEQKRVGMNADALLVQVGSEKRWQDIERKLLFQESIRDFNNDTRGFSGTWSATPPYKIEGIKVLSRLLQQVDSIFDLLRRLKTSDFQYDIKGDEHNEFEEEVKALLNSHPPMICR